MFNVTDIGHSIKQALQNREVKQYSDSSSNLTEHEVLTSFEVQLQDIVTDTDSSEFKVDKITENGFYFIDSSGVITADDAGESVFLNGKVIGYINKCLEQDRVYCIW